MRVVVRVGERLDTALVLKSSFGVVPRTIECEEVRIFDQKRVEATKELVVLDHVIVGTDVRELARFGEIPMVEIKAAAGARRRDSGNSEGRSESWVNQLG